MNIEELRTKVGTLEIIGVFGKKEVNFLGLKNFIEQYKLNDEQKSTIETLENSYLELLNAEYDIIPMKVDNDHKVIVEDGAIFHRLTSNNKEHLQNFAILGVLATEWFGELEAECEGRFCTFLNRVTTKGTPSTIADNNFNRNPNENGQIVFFFDDKNPIMKKLVSSDFFEYAHIKKRHPELIDKMYTQDYINLIEKMIGPLSRAGMSMHDDPNSRYINWMAIPGGVPPQLINGVAIHTSNKGLIDNLDDINKMFPNATIFDENKKILRVPINQPSNKKTRK